jgi:hypothetical protein
VGLAMQQTMSDLFACTLILVYRPFNVGDYVDLGKGLQVSQNGCLIEPPGPPSTSHGASIRQPFWPAGYRGGHQLPHVHDQEARLRTGDVGAAAPVFRLCCRGRMMKPLAPTGSGWRAGGRAQLNRRNRRNRPWPDAPRPARGAVVLRPFLGGLRSQHGAVQAAHRKLRREPAVSVLKSVHLD